MNAPRPTHASPPGGGADIQTDLLIDRVYDELRSLAAAFMRSERTSHTLQPTAVVHEVWMRLAAQQSHECVDEVHFRALAAIAIRRFLKDHARRTLAQKRGLGWSRVALEGGLEALASDPARLLELEELIDQLRELDARQARVVELRYFGGLSIDECAEVLGVSPRTVDGDWRLARAWLRRALLQGNAP